MLLGTNDRLISLSSVNWVVLEIMLKIVFFSSRETSDWTVRQRTSNPPTNPASGTTQGAVPQQVFLSSHNTARAHAHLASGN